MKYKAVIFDLFGTLVYPISQQEYRRIMSEMASVLSIDSHVFIRLWAETSEERGRGDFKDCRENIEYICRQVDSRVEESRIELAAQVHLDMTRSQEIPRPDAVAVLSEIRSRGYRTGIISNCSHHAIIIWEETPLASLFDTAIFSCSVGITKPDLQIYELALSHLSVEAGDCMYVGDGGSHELEGAEQAGMQAVLLRIPGEDSSIVYERLSSEEWDGPRVSSLTGVLRLLE